MVEDVTRAVRKWYQWTPPSGRVYTFSYEALESSILAYLEVERAVY